MGRIISFVYGTACYGLFLAVFLYLVGFVNDVAVPKTVSSGAAGELLPALLVDLGLLVLFGVQHSVMARPGFKHWLTGFVPEAVERSTYVLATNVVLLLTFLYWLPIPGTIWQVEAPALRMALYGFGALGWLIVLVSTFLTNHFDLFGLRQIWLNLVRRTYTPVAFKEHFIYRSIRHPMMLGIFIAFWSTPSMTASHLLFALGMSVYILIGVHYEERGLRAALGQPYIDYSARTGRFLPFA